MTLQFEQREHRADFVFRELALSISRQELVEAGVATIEHYVHVLVARQPGIEQQLGRFGLERLDEAIA
jgi:hypothetical protein